MIQDLFYALFEQKKDNTDKPMVTLMQVLASEKSIPYGSEMFVNGISQYRDNISEVLKKAKNHHIPVIISEVVSNIKDQQPFDSESSTGQPSANDVYNHAKELEKNGQFDKAKDLYYKAKDLDIIRFRAPEEINATIHELARFYKSAEVTVIPMKSIFENHSPNGLIGNNLILEHLHPNIDGYFLIADAFFQEMRTRQLISDKWNSDLIKPGLYYRKNWGFTDVDSLYADQRIKALKESWPFVPISHENKFKETYTPKSLADSVAFFSSPYYETKHVALAQYYSKIKENNLAFNEYLSLIRSHPYLFKLYLDASEFLAAQGKFAQAIDLINSAPDKTDLFAYYYNSGILRMRNGEVKLAIESLNRANSIAGEKHTKIKALIALRNVFRAVNEKENEAKTLQAIRKIDPSFLSD